MWPARIQGSETLTPSPEIPELLWVTHLLKSWWKRWTLYPPPQRNHWLTYTHQLIYNVRGLAAQHRPVFVILTALLVVLTHCWLMLNWLTTQTHTTSKNFCKSRPLSSLLLFVKTSLFPKYSCKFSSHSLGPAFQLSEVIRNSILAHVLHNSATLSSVSPINC